MLFEPSSSVGLSRISVAHSAGSIWTEWAVPGVRLKTVPASLHSVVRLQRMRRGNVFVSTRRRSKAREGRVDVRRARVILARASSVKKLDRASQARPGRGCRGLLEQRQVNGLLGLVSAGLWEPAGGELGLQRSAVSGRP